MYSGDYLGLNSDYVYAQYATPTIAPSITNIDGPTTIITTINGGGGGQASGPNVTISGGVTGMTFVASGNTITLQGTLDVDNGGTGATTASAARANLGAAKSGVNADITQFTGLTGNGGFHAWTGTPDQASHATYSGTASVGYVQAELQGMMDSLQQVTGLVMALLTALLANGVVET